MPYIQSIQSGVKMQAVRDRLADVLDLVSVEGFKTVRTEIQRRSEKESKHSAIPAVSTQKNVARPANEQLNQRLDLSLMLAIFLNGELFTFVRGTLQIEDFDSESARELFVIMEESFRSQEEDIDLRIERIDNPELKALVQKERIAGTYTTIADAFVRDGLQRVKLRNLLRRGKYVDFELRRLAAEGSPDPSVERELLEEKIIIDQAIKELRTTIDDRSAE
jgi:DNA primase